MIINVKTIKYFFTLLAFSCLLFSCASKETTEVIISEPTPLVVEPESNVEITEPEVIVQPEEVLEPVEEINPEPISKEDQEYSRSVTDLGIDVSKETFNEDKSEILEIIEKLSGIMKNKDYAAWLNYLTPESKTFWSNQQNLALVSQRLPIKNYRLKNLQDYFEKVFIPSRIGRVVDEIRYVSTTKVKAVQYTEEQDIIYYYFEKIDGRWYLHLDTST